MSKTVLITGGSRGIGRATALLCGARGWSVAVNYRRDAAAAAETVALVEQAGGRAVALAGDVAEDAAHPAMWAAAAEALGPVTALVANAGIAAEAGPLAGMAPARLRRMIEVNTVGTLLTMREAALRMGRSHGGQGGTAVIVSSAAARLGSAGVFVDYAASKGALDTLTLGLGQELIGDGIRVNGVRPGLIETDIHDDMAWDGRLDQLAPTTPIGRAGSAQEVAEAIVWLLDEASSYVVGSLLDVAGGR
ncbi:MAG: SDR family oxidoreductase [Pseudomonadota bacterium]